MKRENETGRTRPGDLADHRRRAEQLRRAEALRENLRRRKAQLRQRDGEDGGEYGKKPRGD